MFVPLRACFPPYYPTVYRCLFYVKLFLFVGPLACMSPRAPVEPAALCAPACMFTSSVCTYAWGKLRIYRSQQRRSGHEVGKSSERDAETFLGIRQRGNSAGLGNTDDDWLGFFTTNTFFMRTNSQRTNAAAPERDARGRDQTHISVAMTVVELFNWPSTVSVYTFI